MFLLQPFYQNQGEKQEVQAVTIYIIITAAVGPFFAVAAVKYTGLTITPCHHLKSPVNMRVGNTLFNLDKKNMMFLILKLISIYIFRTGEIIGQLYCFTEY